MDIEQLLAKTAYSIRSILEENLVGIYLHGSLAMGCFNPNKSDIDIIVVVPHALSRDEKQRMAKSLLLLHDEIPSGLGFEMSIVLRSVVQNFIHPTPFEFHYSNYHRDKYATDENYICGGFEDPDLAAHFTVIYHRGRTIHGEPIENVFQPIPREYYIQSILNDIAEAPALIQDSPVYYTLNLCRVLFYLKEGIVSSKREGGEWGMRALPQFETLIANCLDQYNGEGKTDNSLLIDEYTQFAEFMLKEITLSK
ncbi:aminoglycoside adenylyltransferase domain-containing protein [Paenibacillus xylaniclasticus]|uniref:aminoglycoside adenylyltransferase domain-containing protein n=1 Tax=Paenibacillus xylaniclasticus TaxID=588083 RepID=UPI0017669AA6|nr:MULTISPECIES: aminoglycoside adenylyltransferase domain-containing protein [Paenibacillus]GFN33020.1 streptomycin 3''-adenylyltransferase [Paenibacillus curdlanolyticus]